MDIRKVLLVDDDPAIRRIAQFCLERIGNWQVLIAADGAEAIAAARAEQPDLILLDFRLPDTDGPALLAEFRSHEQTCRIPVIFMTARVQQSEVEEYRKLDVSGVITKPFDPLTLVEEIKALIGAGDPVKSTLLARSA